MPSPSSLTSRIREITNPADRLAAEFFTAIDDHAPDHHAVCAVVRPSGKVVAMHNLTDLAEVVAVLRHLADSIEKGNSLPIRPEERQ